LGQGGIDSLLLQALVGKEVLERREGGVGIGEPEEEEFFEGGFAIGKAFGGALEPGFGGNLDGSVGELLGEGQERRSTFRSPDS
jgi:hypothetical protein